MATTGSARSTPRRPANGPADSPSCASSAWISTTGRNVSIGRMASSQAGSVARAKLSPGAPASGGATPASFLRPRSQLGMSMPPICRSEADSGVTARPSSATAAGIGGGPSSDDGPAPSSHFGIAPSRRSFEIPMKGGACETAGFSPEGGGIRPDGGGAVVALGRGAQPVGHFSRRSLGGAGRRALFLAEPFRQLPFWRALLFPARRAQAGQPFGLPGARRRLAAGLSLSLHLTPDTRQPVAGFPFLRLRRARGALRPPGGHPPAATAHTPPRSAARA